MRPPWFLVVIPEHHRGVPHNSASSEEWTAGMRAMIPFTDVGGGMEDGAQQ